ncbi:hypothetical protein ACA910_014727 [Epithemia clementina (nom. ined.)]
MMIRTHSLHNFCVLLVLSVTSCTIGAEETTNLMNSKRKKKFEAPESDKVRGARELLGKKSVSFGSSKDIDKSSFGSSKDGKIDGLEFETWASDAQVVGGGQGSEEAKFYLEFPPQLDAVEFRAYFDDNLGEDLDSIFLACGLPGQEGVDLIDLLNNNNVDFVVNSDEQVRGDFDSDAFSTPVSCTIGTSSIAVNNIASLFDVVINDGVYVEFVNTDGESVARGQIYVIMN